MKKKVINERMGVSDEVKEISERITDFIIRLSKNKGYTRRSLGHYAGVPFYSDEFTLDTESVIGDVSVELTVFYCKDETDYKMLIRYGVLNCAADSDNNTLLINTALIGEEVEEGLDGHIAHEVNHLYQYSNGFKKNTNLYDAIIKVLQNPSISPNEKSPAYLVYCTFRHEVDSFATQYYHMLMSSDNILSFSESKEKFPQYGYVRDAYNTVKALDKETLKKCTKQFGLTPKQWRHRVESGINRLENKFKQVYHRYRIDKSSENRTVEGIVRMRMHLYEQYRLTEEKIEPIFNIDKLS